MKFIPRILKLPVSRHLFSGADVFEHFIILECVRLATYYFQNIAFHI